MSRRLAALLAALVAVELGLFYWQYRDVVALAAGRQALVADASFPAVASAALERDQISRRLLERVADVARERREFDLQVKALERIAAGAPQDVTVRVRLAQALRDAGRLDEAEQHYRQALDRLSKERSR